VSGSPTKPATLRYRIDLYWLPLGVRGRWLRIAGRIFEAGASLLVGRRPMDLYHSVLEVRVPEGRYVIEMGPVADVNGSGRGVVAEGAVGTCSARRLRFFRYEVRRWRDGTTAYDFAVESPRLVSDDTCAARRLLALVPAVPTAVWGRDDLHAGERWCCNSLTSWLLASSGIDVDAIEPPAGGRAPGWKAGITVAHRDCAVLRGRSAGEDLVSVEGMR
jgi:hypothetical protein